MFGELEKNPPFELPWSHYLQLMRIEDKDERSFYEIEAISGNWSVRTLQRQYNSSYYERLALSRHEYIIDAYGKILFGLYPDRCLKVLANVADRQTRNSKNRRDYKYVARILKRKAAQPGGKEIAAELAAKYRAQYPRRSAMIDELKRF